jgi:hypothetical protein
MLTLTLRKVCSNNEHTSLIVNGYNYKRKTFYNNIPSSVLNQACDFYDVVTINKK